MNIGRGSHRTVRDVLGDNMVAELYKKAVPKMMNACTYRGICRDDAQDVTQMSFVAVLFMEYDETKHPKTMAHWINYLGRRAKYEASHYQDSKWHRIMEQQCAVTDENGEEVDRFEMMASDVQLAWERMNECQEKRIRWMKLGKFFDKMDYSKTTRRVFCRRLNGDSYEEIAKDYGITMNNCYQIVNRVWKVLPTKGRDIFMDVYSHAA